ncbi:MAG: hypothetical protein H6704_30290 [Myxococcales bacterium]|nr:hypothetical protein [Myxococcales bacterium]
MKASRFAWMALFALAACGGDDAGGGAAADGVWSFRLDRDAVEVRAGMPPVDLDAFGDPALLLIVRDGVGYVAVLGADTPPQLGWQRATAGELAAAWSPGLVFTRTTAERFWSLTVTHLTVDAARTTARLEASATLRITDAEQSWDIAAALPGEPDGAGPTVTLTVVGDWPAQSVRARFSEPVAVDAVRAGARWEGAEPGGGLRVEAPASASGAAASFTLTLDPPLGLGEQGRLVVADVRDLAGNALIAPGEVELAAPPAPARFIEADTDFADGPSPFDGGLPVRVEAALGPIAAPTGGAMIVLPFGFDAADGRATGGVRPPVDATRMHLSAATLHPADGAGNAAFEAAAAFATGVASASLAFPWPADAGLESVEVDGVGYVWSGFRDLTLDLDAAAHAGQRGLLRIGTAAPTADQCGNCPQPSRQPAYHVLDRVWFD